MLFAMANAGLPATSGFVGEFMVILASVKVNFWLGFTAATIMILGAAYTLWMYKRVIYGAIANAHVAALTDLNRREFWLLATLAALLIGFVGGSFLDLEAVMTFGAQRGAGLRPQSTAPRAAVGVDLLSRLGPVPAPCRVCRRAKCG